MNLLSFFSTFDDKYLGADDAESSNIHKSPYNGAISYVVFLATLNSIC